MATKTEAPPTFKTTGRREAAGRAWLAAKAAKDAADASLHEAREALIKALPIQRHDGDILLLAVEDVVSTAVLHVGEQAIQVQVQERREFDVDALDESVTYFVFSQVTEVKVSAPAFDSAVDMGLISPAVIDAVVTPKPTLAIREVKP